MLSQDFLQDLRSELHLGRVLFAPSLPSTNITAHEWLSEDCPNFSLIVADQQISGKGRLGRRWHTNPGSALAFSLVITKDLLPLTSYSGSVAVSIAQALSSFTNALVEIKWPNDILIDGSKVCGVLTETVWNGDVPTGIVLGIGINIFETSLEVDEPLRFPATYLQRHTDATVSRAEVLRLLLQQLILNHDPEKWPVIHAAWNKYLAFKGQQIRAIRQEDEEISGTLLGVASTGELEISLADSGPVLYNANEIQRITPTTGFPKDQDGSKQ